MAFLLTAFGLRSREIIGPNNTNGAEDGELPTSPVGASDQTDLAGDRRQVIVAFKNSMRQSMANAVSLNRLSTMKLNTDDIANQQVQWVHVKRESNMMKSKRIVDADYRRKSSGRNMDYESFLLTIILLPMVLDFKAYRKRCSLKNLMLKM